MPQKLGQHFLKNKSVISAIITALNLRAGDHIIEIGPGKGALTLPLARACAEVGCTLTAIEKDAKLVNWLTSELVNKNVGVVHGDALREIKNQISKIKNKEGFKIVGNIPYYITGKLLRVIGELETKPALTVLTIQKEVAERLAAKPGDMNLLAAATQIWADISIIARLKPDDFDPPPKVESAVITLMPTMRTDANTANKLANYYKLIHAAFKQPRKTLLNNLAEGLGRGKEEVLAVLKKMGFDEKTRGQELAVADLVALSTLISH